MDKSRKRTEEVSRGNDKWACIDKEVPEVSMSVGNQVQRMIRKAVVSNKQWAKTDPIQNTTPKTQKATKVPQEKALALNMENYEFPRRSQPDYNILACHDSETGKMTFHLLPKANTITIPNDKRVTAGTHAARKTIGIADISELSGLQDHAGYIETGEPGSVRLLSERYMGTNFPC